MFKELYSLIKRCKKDIFYLQKTEKRKNCNSIHLIFFHASERSNFSVSNMIFFTFNSQQYFDSGQQCDPTASCFVILFFFQKSLADFENKISEERKRRLYERKEKRREERRQKWLQEKAEEKKRLRDEQLKSGRAVQNLIPSTY